MPNSLLYLIQATGFFHVPPDQESKLLTVMRTPFGIYVHNVLAMGLSNAMNFFETCIHKVLKGLNGCTNISDDVLEHYGFTYGEFKNNVLAFLDHCVQEDMHLNPDKVKIDCHEVLFFRSCCLRRSSAQTIPKYNSSKIS